MHSHTVVGYTHADGMLCADCGDDTNANRRRGMWDETVFAGFEVDTPQHCAACKCLIEGQRLTHDGEKYVRDALLNAKEPTETLDSWCDLATDFADATRVYGWVTARHRLLAGQQMKDIPEPLRSLLEAGNALMYSVEDNL